MQNSDNAPLIITPSYVTECTTHNILLIHNSYNIAFIDTPSYVTECTIPSNLLIHDPDNVAFIDTSSCVNEHITNIILLIQDSDNASTIIKTCVTKYPFNYHKIFNRTNEDSQYLFHSSNISSLVFKLILESVRATDKHKGGSFKRSKKSGNLILKCMTPLKSKTKFIISVGFEMNIISTITHDFNENACCILNYEQIKFNKYVNENTGICEILLYTTLLS